MQSPNNECDPFFYLRKNCTNAIKKMEKKSTLVIQFLLQGCEFLRKKLSAIYAYFLVKIPSFPKACGLVMPLTIIARGHICLHMYKHVYLCLNMPKA